MIEDLKRYIYICIYVFAALINELKLLSNSDAARTVRHEA